MHIGSRTIGPDHPPYVIAEIGVNHDGEVDRALMLTDKAADAGADAIKLQYFETDRLMSRAAKLAAYQKDAGETDPIAMLRRLELNLDEMALVVDRAHKRGIHAIVTVFSVELVELAERLPWDAYKTASPDIVHRPLLERLMATGKPMIVSTGASTLEEVVRTVGARDGDGWLADARDRLAVLQCVSSYPAPSDEIGGIRTIAEATGLPTGYSDHTQAIDTGVMAVVNGASVLERHITYDRTAAGPDHAASLEPDEFRSYAAAARRAVPELTSAATAKHILDCEVDVRIVSRQSIVTRHPLPPGHVMTTDDLTFKRPGTGILPFELDSVVGKKVVREIAADVPMMWKDLEP